MKQIRLLRVELEHFKCHEALVLEPRGEDCVVTGANGAGKSGVREALEWVLFDREAGVRPLGAGREVVTAAEVTLEAAGVPRRFCRTLREDGGSRYAYFVDGVSLGKTRYLQAVGDMAPELRVLMEPRFFPQALPWRGRLDLLCRAVEMPSDRALLEADPALRPLLEAMGQSSPDAYRQRLLARGRRNRERVRALGCRAEEVEELLEELAPGEDLSGRLEELFEAHPRALETERRLRARLREELRRAEGEARFSGDCPLCGQGLRGASLERAEARRREARERVELLRRELDTDFEERLRHPMNRARLETLEAELGKAALRQSLARRARVLRGEALRLQEGCGGPAEEPALLERFRAGKRAILEERLDRWLGPGRIRLSHRGRSGCELMEAGVPYDLLGAAGQVNAGLRLTGDFARRWDTAAPVLLDDVQGIGLLTPAPGQLIRFAPGLGPVHLERG